MRLSLQNNGEVVSFIVVAKNSMGEILNNNSLKLDWIIDRPDLVIMTKPGEFRAVSGKTGLVGITVREVISGISAKGEILISQTSELVNNGSSGASGAAGPSSSGGLVESGGQTNSQTVKEEVSSFGCLRGNCKISVVAGNGIAGRNGDNGPAIAAQLNEPRGITLDHARHIFISDTLNNQVRRVDLQTGKIVTWAGIGQIGDLENGIPSNLALLNFPQGLIIDADGNLLLTEVLNNRLQILTTDDDSYIFNYAGIGQAGLLGNSGPAVSAQLNSPSDVATDQVGNVYIADSLNHEIRKVAPDGQISAFAGTGFPGFSGDGGLASQAQLHLPQSVAVDNKGNVFIADTLNHCIRKIDVGTGKISILAGTGQPGFSGDGGPALQARLNEPSGIALDNQDNIYIADTFNNRVRLVNVQSGIITSLTSEGELLNPYDIAVDEQGKVYIADSLHHQIKCLMP